MFKRNPVSIRPKRQVVWRREQEHVGLRARTKRQKVTVNAQSRSKGSPLGWPTVKQNVPDYRTPPT
eukprot:9348921-Pyramimonas_sp.AAC.2